MRSSRSVKNAILLSVGLVVGCGGFERGTPSPDAGCEPGADETFATEVHPILTERCDGCHGASSSTPFALSGDAAADRATVLRFADLDAPERSPILLKATGNGHGGGTLISSGSAEYTTILKWLQGDAQVQLRDCASDGGGDGTGGGGAMDAAVDGSIGDAGSSLDADLPDATVTDGGLLPDAAVLPLGFASDVHALLTDDCVPCHAAGGPAASSGLLLSAVAADDYPGVLALVDVDDAQLSPLLTKAAGDSHGGGERFATDSVEYALLVEWVEAGAVP